MIKHGSDKNVKLIDKKEVDLKKKKVKKGIKVGTVKGRSVLL